MKRSVRKHEERKKTQGAKPRFLPLLIATLLLISLILLFNHNSRLSEGYMLHVYPLLASFLSSISGIFPFSLYDLFLTATILWLIGMTTRLIFQKRGWKRYLYSVGRFVLIVIAWFYLGWGIAYFRGDFYDRSGVEKAAFDREELMRLTEKFIVQANQSYTDCSEMDKEAVRLEIEQSYAGLREPLCISYPNGRRRVKPMLYEPLYTGMGISGYFGPFFNEIHVNHYGLSFTYPFTLAHEMAHHFGIAAESEANLYSFAACAHSTHPMVRYSGYVSVLGYLLRDARRLLPDAYESLEQSIRPEIIADLQRNSEHWMAARNEILSDTQDKMYDAYLKTNGVSSGRDNYSEVVGLLLSSYNLLVD
ncbi:MAG: hypothetical protein XE13_0162 [Proteiniphilum sp. 51_7]|nr:MAG: hypothetical protein XE13_0162 [Proteiniphilum sp. 51_7]